MRAALQDFAWDFYIRQLDSCLVQPAMFEVVGESFTPCRLPVADVEIEPYFIVNCYHGNKSNVRYLSVYGGIIP